MNDETKAELMKRTREWLQSCVNAATRSGVPEEADLEAFILAHIDGEPARLAAAREEQAAESDRAFHAALVGDTSYTASLTATPLADEIAALRARVAELERQREGMLMGGVTTEARAQLERAEKAEARVAELEHLHTAEVQHANRWAERATTATARVAELEAFGQKVSAIRDSIVGAQAFNWSEHAYPLVAALGAAGFEGAGYKIASENFGTLLDRIEAAEARAAELAESLRLANENVVRLAKAHAETAEERDALRAERDEVTMLLSGALYWTVASELMAANHTRAAHAVVDELAALRARVAELEAQVAAMEEYKQERDDVEVATQRLRFWAENPYACPVHFGARTACGQCYDSERALRLAAEAQVAAARAACARLVDRPWSRWAGDAGRDVLRAMDEASKK